MKLAGDLGLLPSWPQTVLDAEKQARRVHGAGRTWARRAAVAVGVGGLVVIAIAAPYLVLAAAPEGATGAAALVGGLAALGPGGMAGGLGAVGIAGGLVGGATGVGVAALSAAAVEETVIGLQALCSAANRLQENDIALGAWASLVDMEAQAAHLVGRLRTLSDDDARSLKDADAKSSAIGKALDWVDENVGPSLFGS